MIGTTRVRLSIVLMALPALAPRSSAQTPKIRTLYAFNGYVTFGDGIEPNSPLVIGCGGVLYGTTYEGGASNYGTLFALSPPPSAGGSWTETQIHVFAGGTDGLEPTALVRGSHGVLYGVTAGGGSGCGSGCGTAFSLTPPRPDGGSPDGLWTKETYEFNSTIVLPGTLRSAGGVLYGTSLDGGTSPCDAFLGCGTLFSLAPPAGWGHSWTARVLYSFPDGAGGYRPVMAVLGRDGVFYGTSLGGNPNCPFGCGLVFSLTPGPEGNPPVGSWTENVLHTFIDYAYDGDGVAGLVIGDGPSGHPVLYGTTSGGGIYGYGTAFSLTPPFQSGDSWTEKIVYNFSGPSDAAFPNPGLVMGKAGVIYGTSYGILGGGPAASGAVFSLTPPFGGGSWTMTVLHGFTDGDDGGNPVAGVVIGDDGVLYGTTTTGGGSGKFGTVFALRP